MRRTISRLMMTLLLVAFASPAWGQLDRRDQRSTTQSKAPPTTSSDYAASEMKRGTSALKVAGELQSTYREGDDRMGTILMEAGYSPPQVMQALIAEGVALDLATGQVGRGGPHVGGPEDYQLMAQTLADGGHSVAEIVEVLVAVYDADAGMIASALRLADFDAAGVAQALRTEMGADAAAAATAMNDGGFIWPSILVGLTEGGFGGDLPDYLAALYQAGAPQQYVQSAIEQKIDPETVAHWLSRVVQP